MKRSQLVQLIREELEKYPAHKNIEANLMRVVKGEKPQLKMSKEGEYSREDLIDYLSQLEPNIDVTVPSIGRAGFSPDVGWRTTAAKAKDALGKVEFDGKFELFQDYPRYKHFTLIQSPEELEKRSKFMRDFGGLD
jgi:hypothetical protein